MSAIRTVAFVIALLGVGLQAPTAPTPEQIARWIEDLASDDTATWRQAVDHLWKAGPAKTEKALRAATKSRDADVVLRARLVLSRFDWGILADTPTAVVKA